MKFFARLRDIFSKIKCKCACSSSCMKIQINHNENNKGRIDNHDIDENKIEDDSSEN